MIKYMKGHLTAKLFLITAAMLLAASAVTYGFIALYAPGRYLIAVEENLSREAEGLVSEMEQANAGEAQGLLDQFTTEYAMTLTLKEERIQEEGIQEEGIQEEGIQAEGLKEEQGAGRLDKRAKKRDAAYEFQFKDSPEIYTLTIGGAGRTAKPFNLALKQILPPLMAVVFVLALSLSVFYSRYITRPVLELSEASKKSRPLISMFPAESAGTTSWESWPGI